VSMFRPGTLSSVIQAALREARGRGADAIGIGVDEPDLAARRLCKSMGFTDRIGGADGPGDVRL
jgi:hypothetical protein